MLKKGLLTIFVIVGMYGSYLIGEYHGIKKGVEITTVFSISGRSAEQANMLSLMLSLSRRGEKEKMYEWGEKFLVSSVETHMMIQSELQDETKSLKDSDSLKTLQAMVDETIYESTQSYIDKYLIDDDR
ncbi:hypothetical protein [Microbulbifer agarilyticus]|uniref:hypothetical protein n=1 Tax=Microbulbifer agarilyticus TaxID=260552 RepID=UPI001CD5824E|nr:hypothetical protein [Microbulbifer agarilyticus]MCA0902211.1 hypothetical protein [Microbulbifer agarilyticus]